MSGRGIALAAILLSACVAGAATPGQPAEPPGQPPAQPPTSPRVLFIGNSLTYENELPALVAALADSAGVGPLATEAVVAGGYSLEDHWGQGDARRAIARGGWTVVVLQQGPSSLVSSRVNLIEYARRFATEIRAVGARPALYMVWPESVRLDAFDGVSQSYSAAATAVDGLLFPAGEAWRAAWRRDPNLPLYGPDGFHPSPMGSYLAALVMFGQLHQRSPVGLPPRITLAPGGVTLEVPAARATLLQEAAAEANRQFGRR